MTNAEARFNKIHIRKVYARLAVTCHLHFWQNDRDFFTCYCGNTGGGTDTEIRVSTESRPWRRKFSRRSSRDSNPRPFNHESGALTTELSPPPTNQPSLKSFHVLMRMGREGSLNDFKFGLFVLVIFRVTRWQAWQ